MTTDLRAALRGELVAAMKRKDRSAVSACRTTLAALDNAEAVDHAGRPGAGAIEQSAVGAGAAEVDRRVLTSEEEAALVREQIAERRHAAALDSVDAVTTARLEQESALLVNVLAQVDTGR